MARRREDPNQLPLFDWAADTPAPPTPGAAARAPRGEAGVGPAPIDPADAQIAARLTPQIRLGTSSWSFPGWAGIVYDRATDETTLARHGLAAYARHPLLRAAGIDKTYYRPITAAAFRELAEQTPAQFRFLVKASQECTLPTLRQGTTDDSPATTAPADARGRGAAANPNFLNAVWTTRYVVEPFIEGLGDRAGALVFQFSRMRLGAASGSARGTRRANGPQAFLDRLNAFLAALPRGPAYVVEIRNPELWGPEYFAALQDAGATHCYNVHPQMPPIGEQLATLPPAAESGPCVIRWMLERSQSYAGAREAYAPFDRLVDEDAESRAAIRALCIVAARAGRDVIAIANNKAEGSAPLTVFKLAREIVAHWEDVGEP